MNRIKNWLNDRAQRSLIRGIEFRWKLAISGIPQGSILVWAYSIYQPPRQRNQRHPPQVCWWAEWPIHLKALLSFHGPWLAGGLGKEKLNEVQLSVRSCTWGGTASHTSIGWGLTSVKWFCREGPGSSGRQKALHESAKKANGILGVH